MARSRDGASLTDWASQQTRQLADLWQQWQDQQVRSQRQQQQQQQDRKHAGNENQDPNPAAGTRLLKQSQASQAAVPPADSSVHSDSRDSRPAVYTAARYMEPSDQASGAATAVGVPGTAASTQGINTQQHDPKLQQVGYRIRFDEAVCLSHTKHIKSSPSGCMVCFENSQRASDSEGWQWLSWCSLVILIVALSILLFAGAGGVRCRLSPCCCCSFSC